MKWGINKMQCVERYEKHQDDDFDAILLKIKNGTIKSGRYANMVKINKDWKLKGKEFFKDGRKEKDKDES